MGDFNIPEIPPIDTTELKQAMADLEDALAKLKAGQYAREQGPPEIDPNEPNDYESKTHGY
tara:strand:+ start:3931 stop:4113 length:183 start_codon:yes stop_codon:yes gene_type:complete